MRLIVNTAELRHAPGSTKQLTGSVSPDEVGLDDPRLVPGRPVEVDVCLASVDDGVLITGTVAAAWQGSCRRCLDAAQGVEVATVDERYQYVVTDQDAFPITDERLDLTPLVRETVLLELPDAPLCRDECGGWCASCGANLTAGACGCTDEPRDARWGALDALRDTFDE
jgi:uncharacterized protein